MKKRRGVKTQNDTERGQQMRLYQATLHLDNRSRHAIKRLWDAAEIMELDYGDLGEYLTALAQAYEAKLRELNALRKLVLSINHMTGGPR